MSKRLDAIVQQWSHSAKWDGGTAAKRYRVNLRKAGTAAAETARLFEGFEFENRKLLAGDIELLKKAAVLLNGLGADFEAAQKMCDRIQSDATKKRDAERAEQVKATILELFGPAPDPQTVLSMGADLDQFDQTGVDEFAKRKGCERGLISTVGASSSGIRFEVSRGNVAQVAKKIAEMKLDCQVRGSRSQGTDRSYWHAGWEDFIEWRKSLRA